MDLGRVFVQFKFTILRYLRILLKMFRVWNQSMCGEQILPIGFRNTVFHHHTVQIILFLQPFFVPVIRRSAVIVRGMILVTRQPLYDLFLAILF